MISVWKPNWKESRQHFIDWWNREGLVLGSWDFPENEDSPHEAVMPPLPPASPRDIYTQPELRAMRNHHKLAQSDFPLDILPIAETHIGPGSLWIFLGCEPGFSKETVWYNPCWQDVENPENLPPLIFDRENPWWQLTEKTLRASIAQSKGKYLVACPDLVENIDIICSLRESQMLMMDMIERPEWVEQKIAEINQVFFEAYQRIYDFIKLPDGSSCFGAFRLWGPGKTAKLQCDASAMFSPAMFERFVVPSLIEQCSWLDHSLYHLDGTQAMCHLDALLAIEELDAIEWTPQAGIESGGDRRWYPMYRRILEAGKSLQIVSVKTDELTPLLDAIGGKGVYILGDFESAAEIGIAGKIVEGYRN